MSRERKIHVCFLSNEYPIWGSGGVGSFVQTTGRALVKQGHVVSVVGIFNVKSREIADDEGVAIYRIPRSRLPKFRFIEHARAINRTLGIIHRKFPIDILEGTELGLAFIRKKIQCKKIIRLHGGHLYLAVMQGRDPALWRSFQERRSIKKAHAFIAVSEYVGQKTSNLYGINDRPVRIIYNPVNTKLFSATIKEKTQPKELLFFGTVYETKGIRQLLAAMPLVKKVYPSTRLIVVGRDSKHPDSGGSYIEWLKTSIPASIKDDIIFTGPVPHEDMPKYVKRAEVCVLPSHIEAMPLAWLEVLSMAKPLIASRTGPGPEVIKDKHTGLLVNPQDPKDIADKIVYMLKHPKAATLMGCRGHEDVAQRFAVDSLVAKNIQFYLDCICS